MLSKAKVIQMALAPRDSYRLMRRLYVMRSRIPEVLGEPAFDEGGLAHFKNVLGPGDLLLEYGSGGSTVLASSKGAEVISVDSDLKYVEAVNATLSAMGDTRSRVSWANIGLTAEWGAPVDTNPTLGNLQRWDSYLVSPWENPTRRGRWPNHILVDGRFRVACAAECALRGFDEGVRTTLLLDDFTNRPHYWSVLKLFDVKEIGGRMVELTLRDRATRQEAQELRNVFAPDCR